MKLVNETQYDTAQLRAIIIAVHRLEATHRGRLPQWKSREVLDRHFAPVLVRKRRRELTIRVVRRKRYGIDDSSGHAYVRGYKSLLVLPFHVVDVGTVALLWLHELQHLYGLTHKEMSPSVRGLWAPKHRAQLECYAEAARRAVDGATELMERPAAGPALLAPEERTARRRAALEKAVVTRYERVVEREREWAVRLKRAQTALVKLRTKRRYYERQFATKAAKEWE